jgi:general stress protein 26
MDIKEKAAAIVAAAKVVTLASIDENGYPRPVALVKLKDEQGAIYVSTGTSSAKTAHFRANPKAGMSIVEGENSVVYTGEIEIVTDMAVKKSLWADWMSPHFPCGVDDPEYCVLKFTPRSYTYWIDNVFMKNGEYLNYFCQSCGMPMKTPDQFGTNSDGSANSDYCCYCYKDGAFTQDCTMEQMIEHCAQFVEEFNADSNTKFTKEQAIAQMTMYFPHLKRWHK